MHKLPAHKAKMPSLLWLAKIKQQQKKTESNQPQPSEQNEQICM
jgi:hypothetical protein